MRGIEDDVANIKDEDHWPWWPRLPIKKRDPKGGWPQLGTLMHIEGKWNVYHKAFDERINYKNPQQVFDTPEAVVADGWVVD